LRETDDDVTSRFPNDDITGPPMVGNLTRFWVTSDVIFRVPSASQVRSQPQLLFAKPTNSEESNLTPFRVQYSYNPLN